MESDEECTPNTVQSPKQQLYAPNTVKQKNYLKRSKQRLRAILLPEDLDDRFQTYLERNGKRPSEVIVKLLERSLFRQR